MATSLQASPRIGPPAAFDRRNDGTKSARSSTASIRPPPWRAARVACEAASVAHPRDTSSTPKSSNKLSLNVAQMPGVDAATQATGLPAEDANTTPSRSVPITVHGVASDEDSEWLQREVLQLPGVRAVRVGERREGGLRGGAAHLEVEVAQHIPLPALVNAIHSVEDRLLALPFSTHAWTWRGHRISYGVAGQGSPVVLVHGFGGSASHFRNLVAQLADEHRVYAVDLLGFGDSDKPPHAEYGPELWADIINDFVTDMVEEPAVLIGNSIGSLTALTAAAQASQDSIRGLVLLNVAGAMNRKGLMQDDMLLAALSPIFVAIEYLLLRPSVASFLFERFRSKANVRKILQQQVYRDKNAVCDRLVDLLYEPSQHEGAINVFVRVFTGNPGPRPEELVNQVDVPMLVLWGDSDPWTPINGKVARVFRQLEQQRGNVRVVPLPDVGHCPHDDRPHLAAGHILPWLESLDSA